PRLFASLRVHEATRAMLSAHEAIALVVDADGRVPGIVALEDLLETLTGIAITDEQPDGSARPGADDRRHDRLAALRKRRGRWVSDARDWGKEARLASAVTPPRALPAAANPAPAACRSAPSSRPRPGSPGARSARGRCRPCRGTAPPGPAGRHARAP